MILNRFTCLIYLVLSVCHVSSTDISVLKEHFIVNIQEETRLIASAKLTEDIEDSINLKIEGFLELINEDGGQGRVRRDTYDLLLNEKTPDVYILKGFQSQGFVPVNFPEDICMFQVNQKKFAVTLTYGKIKNGTSRTAESTPINTVTIFYRENGSFRKIHEYQSSFTTKIDCRANKEAGFVAVVNTLTDFCIKDSDDLINHGSFVLRVKPQETGDPKVDLFQKFAVKNQNGVSFGVHGRNFYVIYSYNTFADSPLNVCTIYELGSMTFSPMDELPCQNARVIEIFSVNHFMMVLIGNYRENNGTTNAFSSIMRYDLNQKKFIEHQKIFTNAIVEGKYFFLDHQNQRQHFLFIGNSFEINEFGVIDSDVPSMIYKQVNGFFIPMQAINIRHVQSVLPILGKNSEFHLLIASEHSEVQIYFYDGWKFHESPLDFTGDAFSSGVIAMRSYDDIINGTTAIVISNRESFEPTSNVYTPIYTMKNDPSKLKSSIANWCENAIERLENFDVDQTEKILKNSLDLADPTNTHANFMGNLFVKNSTIGKIMTKKLKGTKVSFDEKTAKRFNALVDRVEKLEIAASHVMNKVRFTKATQRMRRQAKPPMLVKNLVVTGPIIAETINGRPIADLVYSSNQKNKNLKDIVAREILFTKEIFVNGKVDGVEIAEDNVILDRPMQVLRSMKLESLSAKSISDVVKVNSIPFPEFFNLLRRKVDKKIPNNIENLTVESAQLRKLLNGRNFSAIAENSLKITGDQVITGPMKIGNLTANRIMFQKPLRDQKISGVALSSLININERRKRVEINQDLRFDDELNVNRLFVTQRINNINVIDGQLQVLRTRGPTKQIVTGEKFFERVNLESPILLQGKIESKSLEKMNPTAIINEKLVLKGDYVITGPVTIRKSMKVTGDIKTLNEKYTIKNLLENGLNLLTTNSTRSKLVFLSAIEVKGNLEAVSLNQKPVANFVKLNYPELQIVKGPITLKKSLLVRDGMVQADVINDVDINYLNKTILKQFSSVAQFIQGNVEIISLTTPHLLCPNVTLGGKSLDLVLNTDKQQTIDEMIITQVKVKNLEAKSILQQEGGKIFNTDVNFLLNDLVTPESAKDGSIIAEKIFTDLTVEHLMFTKENEWKSILSNYENSISLDLTFTEPVVFDNDVRVQNLVVRGTINGVTPDDIMNNWLKTEGYQVFTAPQNFKSMTVGNNLKLTKEMINDVNMTKIIDESIYINEPIYLKDVVFKSDVYVKGKMTSKTTNGVDLNGKLILNNTDEVQYIKEIVVERDVNVDFLNFTNLNGIDCGRVMKAMSGESNDTKIEVHGKVNFAFPTQVTWLNNENLQQLHDSIWLSDRDTVLTGEDVQFLGGVRSDGYFYSPTINAKDLEYIDENYISLTKNQNIATYLSVNGSIKITKALFADKTVVNGVIKTSETDKGLKIEEFAENVLRHEKEQTISKDWFVKELVIHGDYNGLLNGLNFSTDVLHAGNLETAEVTGKKTFSHVEADNVYADNINNVDINDWLANAVRLNSQEEQYIDGVVEFSDPVFYNDIQVDGLVNGIVFTPETVLTKSGEGQVITGDVTIQTMNEHEVKPLFIENLYLSDTINGWNVTEMVQNTFKRTDTTIDSKMITFEKKIVTDSINIDKNIYGVNITDLLDKVETSKKLTRLQENLARLEQTSDDLRKCYDETVVELSHFEYHQSLYGENIQKTISLIIKGSAILAVHERNTNTSFEVVKFYRWNDQTESFIDDASIKPISLSFASYQITRLDKVVYKAVYYLFVELFEKESQNFYQSLMLLDENSKSFVPAVQIKSEVTSQFFTHNDGATACFGMFFPSFENLKIVCDDVPPTVIQTLPVKLVSSQNEIIILLTDDHQLQIWYQQKIRQVLSVMNPRSFASIRYNGKIFLAVTCDKVQQSVHHGSIEIFESSDDDINFVQVQSFELENPFKVEFSIIPSADLLLYALTKNPGKPLNIFKYAGASYFIEAIESSTIVNTGTDLSTITVGGTREFIAIVSGEVYIIETVLKKY